MAKEAHNSSVIKDPVGIGYICPVSGAIGRLPLGAIRDTTMHHHFACISLHQEVFLRLIWEITKEIAESYTSKDTLDSLSLIVLDICIALGYY